MTEQNPLITKAYRLYNDKAASIRIHKGINKPKSMHVLNIILANKIGIYPKDFIIKNLDDKQLSTIINELSL